MNKVDIILKTIAVILLITFVILSMVGCGGKAQTDAPAATAQAEEMRTFSKYDFSFQCPKEYLIWQDGLLDDEANEESGLIQVAPEEEKFPLFAVSWIRTWQYGLEGGLEAGFEGVNNWEGIGAVTKGQVVETTKTGHRMLYQHGHRMLYQYYTATTIVQGETVYGIVGAFYCPDTQRAFSVVTMEKTLAGGENQEQALSGFENYIDSFVCHS